MATIKFTNTKGDSIFLKPADFAEFSIIWHYSFVFRFYNISRDMADDIIGDI